MFQKLPPGAEHSQVEQHGFLDEELEPEQVGQVVIKPHWEPVAELVEDGQVEVQGQSQVAGALQGHVSQVEALVALVMQQVEQLEEL